MALGHKFTTKTIDMLNDSSTRRTRMETMGNSIPGQRNLVSVTFVVEMEHKLLCHARTWCGVSMSC